MKNWTFALIALLFFSHCKKEEETPQTNILYDIIGSVNLYDESINPVSDAGMTVTVLGTNPLITAVTNESGQFTLSEVPKGTYVLEYTKANYGTYKLYNVDHTKNENTVFSQSPSLGMETTVSKDFAMVNVVNDSVFVSVTTTPSGNVGNSIYIRVFFGKSSGLSLTNYDHYTPVFMSNNAPSVIKFSKAEMISFGFQTGETVYVDAHPTSFFPNDYYDEDAEIQIFPNLNYTEDTQSFVMP